MSTCNFDNRSGFNLWVSYTYDDDDFFWDDLQLNFDYILETLPDLIFHKISLKSGYYSGVQILVEQGEDPTTLDNYDCQYCFGMCKSQAVRLFEAEVKRVNKKILPKFETIGFFKINCLGVFSNGEAIYEVAKK